MIDTDRNTKEELEGKIVKLEDQLNSALHREEVFKDKWRRSDEDCEKYKAEADARGLKVEYLESKLEEKYHVENLFTQLKEDYEELRKEKQNMNDQFETRLMQKEEELRKASIERDEVTCFLIQIYRENIKFERALEEKELESAELRSEVAEKLNNVNNISSERDNYESVIRQKQSRIEYFKV